MLNADPNQLRAAQALSILEALERLLPGQSVTVTREPGDFTAVIRDMRPGGLHRGSSATDALGQLTTVLVLDAADRGGAWG